MGKAILLCLSLALLVYAAEKLTAPRLIALANEHSALCLMPSQLPSPFARLLHHRSSSTIPLLNPCSTSPTSTSSMPTARIEPVAHLHAFHYLIDAHPSVASKYNIRKDSYSHAITGASSGGICSFNAGWQMPDQFSHVISWIGSFTAIQWKQNPATPDGGQDYPEKVLRKPKAQPPCLASGRLRRPGERPLRKLAYPPCQRPQLKHYDFHLSFGKGTHNHSHGAAEIS
jgi:hypothetical protein